MLQNLLSNAIKFTGPDGSIEITAARTGDGYVEVTVSDDGAGIAPEHHELIFERLRQIGDVLTDRPQGAGLGLPVCKGLVHHLGGDIRVESEPGQGSQFHFTVPIAASRRAPSLEAATSDSRDDGARETFAS